MTLTLHARLEQLEQEMRKDIACTVPTLRRAYSAIQFELRADQLALILKDWPEEPKPNLLIYMETENGVERDAAYLRMHAANIRKGLTHDIPNTIAATIEGVAKRMLMKDHP